MLFATEQSVDTALKPYFGDFVALIHGAHEDWAKSPLAATMQDPKVRAINVWNQFLYRAKAKFEGKTGIRVDTMGHWQGLMVGESFFVRMKKSGIQLLSRNYPTVSALNFNDASVDLFDGVVRLELLYSLDELGAAISRIVVVQRHRNKILWAIDLLDDAESLGQTVIPMLNPVPTGTPADRIIKPKKTIVALKKKLGTDDDGA